ncbi:MAG: group 1 glycosyl transferase [Bacteroidetes bacterium OLB10]|nr:MAG: group 1 glycosyl transferase [Bacteroidetes bacterium OLB10]
MAFKQYAQLFWYCIKYRPDLVYVPAGQTTVGYTRDAGYILIAKLFGRKVLTHLRGGYFLNWYNESGKTMKTFIRFVHRKVNGQIVLGNNLRKLFNWIVPEKDIYVIPNGGNFPVNYNERNHEKTTVLFLGNYVRTKGVMEALYAAPLVYAQNKNVQFAFAGEWRDADVKTEFEKFVSEHPELPIINHGPVKGDRKFQILNDADIFVFPTYYRNEGHPWVTVEAMAAGLPVISTDHAAIPESVHDGVNGYLVEKRNISQLAEKIIILANDKALRNKMGAESRRIYLENLTEEKMVERMGNAFRSVIEQK